MRREPADMAEARGSSFPLGVTWRSMTVTDISVPNVCVSASASGQARVAAAADDDIGFQNFHEDTGGQPGNLLLRRSL